MMLVDNRVLAIMVEVLTLEVYLEDGREFCDSSETLGAIAVEHYFVNCKGTIQAGVDVFWFFSKRDVDGAKGFVIIFCLGVKILPYKISIKESALR